MTVILAAGHITWPGAAQVVPIVIVLLAYGALYLVGVRRLRGTTRAVPACNAVNRAANWLVMTWSLCRVSESVMSAPLPWVSATAVVADAVAVTIWPS